jgi:hypothetical protein
MSTHLLARTTFHRSSGFVYLRAIFDFQSVCEGQAFGMKQSGRPPANKANPKDLIRSRYVP